MRRFRNGAAAAGAGRLAVRCARPAREETAMDAAVPSVPPGAMSSRVRAVLLALLINAVPLVGVLAFDWSALDVLVLYWFENVLIAIGTSIRIAVHKALTRKRGYVAGRNRLGIKVNDKPVTSGLLTEYMIASFGFTAAHGVFVVGIVFILRQNFPDQPMWRFSFEQAWHGALAIAAMLAVELVVDLSRIRSISFATMTAYARGRMTRVFVMHLTIIVGMFAMAMTHSPMAILYALIAFKTLADLGGALGQAAAAPAADAANDEETTRDPLP
jgi:hypothetical protein